MVINKQLIIFLLTTLLPLIQHVTSRVFVAESSNRYRPHVAFHCGHHAKFMDITDGIWKTDTNSSAHCIHPKSDIIAYCRKIFSNLNITNVAELLEEVSFDDWCPRNLAQTPENCRQKFSVQPYMCMVGELKSQLGIIPDGCQFDHAEDRGTCQSYIFWNTKAELTCRNMFQNDKIPGKLTSFNVLQPCEGLDSFSAHEYLCCQTRTLTAQYNGSLNQATDNNDDATNDSNEDEGDDNESQEEDNEVVKIDASQMNAHQHSVAGQNDLPNYRDLNVYYRKVDVENEHARYKDALHRLETLHKTKAEQVIREWDQLEERYKEINDSDPIRANFFRKEMIERYQRTISNLLAATKRERYRLSDVHEHRLLATFHERFRLLNEEFDRLVHAFDFNATNYHHGHRHTSSELLKSVEGLVRLVEKFRVRILNHYRHWLKTDSERASQIKTSLIDQLNSNDNLLNSSLNKLDASPSSLARKVKPAALNSWQLYRNRQTPSVDDNEILSIGNPLNTMKLLQFYEKIAFNEDSDSHSTTTAVSRSASTTTTTKALPLESPSASNSFLLRNRLQQHVILNSQYWEDANNEKNDRYAKYWIFVAGGLALLVVAVVTISVLKRRAASAPGGFIQVEASTPEERHVLNMQVNGYSNPTYKYFDQC